MAAHPNGSGEKEISLSDISLMVKKYREKFNDTIFNAILFVQRFIIAIVIILVAGIAYGIYLDSAPKPYDQKILVTPNFESVDYLYQEIEVINTKLSEHDYEYFSGIGIKNPGSIIKIQIEPVIDIYEFIDNVEENELNDRKFEIFRLIAESGEMDKILEDETTSKYYKNQKIVIITAGKVLEDEVITPLITHFNNAPYFQELKKQYNENLDKQIKENNLTVQYIDTLLRNYSDMRGKSSSVYFSDNSALHEVIRQKRYTLESLLKNRINVINYDSVVKVDATAINVKHKGLLINRMKIVVPLFFLFVFVCLMMFISFYKSQKKRREAIA
ncbi:hypothetical protein [Flavobacterium rhizosphaerae]|uniref:Polysaccharide chain length determinant N-terminal domain-containing protein n=1 Tax=Flavobacterium rhizosphaerae TaxID=3163298 RepID=A0ABW8Z189_9FLAO